MKKIYILTILILTTVILNAQVRAIDGAPTNVTTSSAFLDASSNATYTDSTNSAKGIAFPRVNLTTFTAFLGVTGTTASFTNRYDGFIVFNTATSGVAGIGATQGNLSKGFWYYDNNTAGLGAGTIGGGTWRPVGVNTNINSIESQLNVIAGSQVFGLSGSFSLAAAANNVALAEPTGMTKLYRLNVYQSGMQIGVFSYTGGNLIFGGDSFSAFHPAGTYTYTMEYFK